MCLQPAPGADAPAVAGLQAGEAELRHRRGKVVALALGGGKKLLRHDAADGMHAQVFRAGRAATVAIEAGEWVHAAGFKGLAEDVLLRGAGARCGHRLIVVQGERARDQGLGPRAQSASTSAVS
jgi:hypothetical protein